jgi:hypothetical protein
MKKKLDIPKDFWKDFKDRKDFDDFFSELFKEGISIKESMQFRRNVMPGKRIKVKQRRNNNVIFLVPHEKVHEAAEVLK